MSTRYAASPKVILTETQDGGGVLLDLDTKFYFTLNATGVSAWKRLQKGPATTDELGAALAAEFDVSPETAGSDVAALVATLADEGLVKPA